MRPLPMIMVAPNGARRTKVDHPNIPLSDTELLEAAIACATAGADGIHLHIRDATGGHLLDAGRYRRLLNLVQPAVPEMYLQVTSEAAGVYEAPIQQAIMRQLRPRYASVALREMVRQQSDWPTAKDFYTWAAKSQVDIQHIVYSAAELGQFLNAVDLGHIPGSHHLLQLVLGTYDGSENSDPAQIKALTDLLDAASHLTFDWMLCAFGAEESICLVEAIRSGGKARIGFENSLWNADGSQAQNNAERVSELVQMLKGAL